MMIILTINKQQLCDFPGSHNSKARVIKTSCNGYFFPFSQKTFFFFLVRNFPSHISDKSDFPEFRGKLQLDFGHEVNHAVSLLRTDHLWGALISSLPWRKERLIWGKSTPWICCITFVFIKMFQIQINPLCSIFIFSSALTWKLGALWEVNWKLALFHFSSQV